MSSEPLVQRDDHGPIAVLTLNRSAKRNALSRALVAAISDAFDRLAVDPVIRAIVLTGAGPVFCAGMDLKEASETEIIPMPESGQQAVKDSLGLAHLINQIHQFPRPTIAAIQGDALAGGAGLALSCDLAVMADAARIGYPEVRRGLVAAIVLQDLARQIGDRRARQLLLTGQPIDSETALAWGLVNKVVATEHCLEAAIDLAQQIAEAAPLALAATKRLLDEATLRPANLRGPAAISAAIRDSDEAREGIQAFLEKRAPKWKFGPGTIPSYDQRHEGIDPDLPIGPGPA